MLNTANPIFTYMRPGDPIYPTAQCYEHGVNGRVRVPVVIEVDTAEGWIRTFVPNLGGYGYVRDEKGGLKEQVRRGNFEIDVSACSAAAIRAQFSAQTDRARGKDRETE